MNVKWAMIKSLLEKAVWSAGQQFTVIIFGGGAVVVARVSGLPWALALGTAAGAFVMSFVTSGVTALLRLGAMSFWPELARRVVATFGQSLMSMWAADTVLNVFTFRWVTALDVAAAAALLALAKGVLSPNARDRLSPSTLAIGDAEAVKATQA